jgi:photosystem II stability/assembly factor-like uncharacterized protein
MKLVFSSSIFLMGLTLQGALAQSWTTNSGPQEWWTDVASSADGAKLVAVAGEGFPVSIYTSTNAGITWVTRGTPKAWFAVDCSADGSRVVAVGLHNTSPYISADSGLTWATVTIPGMSDVDFQALCCSGDGNLMLAAGSVYLYPSVHYVLYRSADGGTNWTAVEAMQTNVSALTCSGDGQTVFAGTRPGRLYRSTDTGLTWTATTAPSEPWHTLCCSADGTRVYAAVNPGDGPMRNDLYISFDSGLTWQWKTVPAYGLSKLACSADGRRVVLLSAPNGLILTSTDSGATWAQQSVPPNGGCPWNGGAASSADGNSLIVLSSYAMYALKTTPTPTLDFSQMTEGLSLSWTVPSSDFVLQENSEPSATGWTDVTAQPKVDPATEQHKVFVPCAGGARYYRLMGR